MGQPASQGRSFDLSNPQFRASRVGEFYPNDITRRARTHTQNAQIPVGSLGSLWLGVPETTLAESIVWDNWDPDPQEITSTNGVLLLTISDVKLTALRFDTTSPPFQRATLRMVETWQAHDFRNYGSDTRTFYEKLRVFDENGGIVLEYDYANNADGIFIGCGSLKFSSWEWEFTPDLFDLLDSAESVVLPGSLWRAC